MGIPIENRPSAQESEGPSPAFWHNYDLRNNEDNDIVVMMIVVRSVLR